MPLPPAKATMSPCPHSSAEDSRGRRGLDRVAGAEGVDHPVRDDATRYSLDGDLQAVIDQAVTDDIE